MSKNLTQRIIVAAIGIPVLIFVIFEGGYYLYAFALLVSVLGSWELAAMLLSKNIVLQKRLMTVLPIIIVSVIQFGGYGEEGLLSIFILFFLAAILIMSKTGVTNYFANLAATLLAAVYPGFFISFSILIHREISAGWIILLFIFVNIWVADTFAYGFGKWLGKRKLAPSVSPKKTWVGFFAAFAGGLIIAVAGYYLFDTVWPLPVWLLASLAATLFGQLGDLVESAIKRDCGIKDSSNLIPGHGGVLDRFDSLLFALPAVYLVLKLASKYLVLPR